jgi:hypothetical protein
VAVPNDAMNHPDTRQELIGVAVLFLAAFVT